MERKRKEETEAANAKLEMFGEVIA